MDFAIAFLLVVLVILTGVLLVRDPRKIIEALRLAGEQGRMLGMRIPMAVLAATYLSRLIAPEHVSHLIGQQSGIRGIFLASAVGAFTPGGPMLTFPLALVIWRLGAGEAQMVAFLAAWSIFAIHRVLSYELPLLGPRFIAVRLASSWMLPPLAGFLAAGLLFAWHRFGG